MSKRRRPEIDRIPAHIDAMDRVVARAVAQDPYGASLALTYLARRWGSVNAVSGRSTNATMDTFAAALANRDPHAQVSAGILTLVHVYASVGAAEVSGTLPELKRAAEEACPDEAMPAVVADVARILGVP